jgi:hypothetical protein
VIDRRGSMTGSASCRRCSTACSKRRHAIPGFEEHVFAATRDNGLWLGVYYCAERVLAKLPARGGRTR